MRLDRSVVVLDRHPLWLDAVGKLLEGAGVEVVGRATDCDQAVRLVAEHRPDLLVASLVVSDDDYLACLRAAKEAHRALKAVVVAESADPAEIEAVFAAGASVYCVKTADRQDLALAVRQVFQRSIYIAGEPARGRLAQPSQAQAESAARELTRRELEILRLVAEGHSNGQLARMLWVTEQTVKFHLSNIYRKLDVANRTEASRWAQLNGLLPSADVQTLDLATAE